MELFTSDLSFRRIQKASLARDRAEGLWFKEYWTKVITELKKALN